MSVYTDSLSKEINLLEAKVDAYQTELTRLRSENAELRATLLAIASDPIGEPEWTAQQCLNEIEDMARKVLATHKPASDEIGE